MAGGGFRIQRAGNRYHAGHRVDGELAACIVAEAVADTGAEVGVAGQGGDAHGGADGGVFRHGVGVGVVIDRAHHRVVVDVGHRDSDVLRAYVAGRIGGG